MSTIMSSKNESLSHHLDISSAKDDIYEMIDERDNEVKQELNNTITQKSNDLHKCIEDRDNLFLTTIAELEQHNDTIKSMKVEINKLRNQLSEDINNLKIHLWISNSVTIFTILMLVALFITKGGN